MSRISRAIGMTIITTSLAAAAVGVAPVANATVNSLTIDAPTTQTAVVPGGTVDIAITWTETHICGPYRSHITIGDPSNPVAQQTFDYLPGVDIPSHPAGGCNSSATSRSHSFVHTMTVPAGTAYGLYDLRVFTEENFFGSWCCGQTAVQAQVIQVLAGSCPPDDPSWFLEPVGPDGMFDKNGDGYICTKNVEGQGNSANTNRGPGQTGYHVDGHNHKDNND